MKPEQAFFVRCDRKTMTQNDFDNGRLICLIGVAAVKPAEFVIFRIGRRLRTRRIEHLAPQFLFRRASMILRDTPYGAFHFQVDLGDGLSGGFSEVSGLVTEMTGSEYRNGTDAQNHVRKIPGVHKVGDVTLKRGLIGEKLFEWIKQTRTDGHKAKRTVTISLLDEARSAIVATWRLSGVMPLKYTGPTLAAKGGGDVAMEELVLSCEGFVLE
jgi:phage tail-like protein